MTSDSKAPSSVGSPSAVRVTTGARLHFGLLDTVPPFGGIGAMIEQPATEVRIAQADQFVADDGATSRITEIARRFADHVGLESLPDCIVEIVNRPEPHTGLGTGTQLSLAVAEGIAKLMRFSIDPEILAAQIADRGKRSAVGVHGYFQGGLIFESNSSEGASELNRVQNRVALPDSWTVVIARPADTASTVSGDAEQTQFDRVTSASEQQRESLLTIITDQILPAAVSADFDQFTSAIHQYNYQSGMLFSGVQGGPYNGSQVTELVQLMIDHGARGVGQSSWGPSVFSWFESASEASRFCDTFANQQVLLRQCGVLNQSRSLS